MSNHNNCSDRDSTTPTNQQSIISTLVHRGYLSAFWYQVYQEKPETVRMACLTSYSNVFLVEPDKLDIKRYYHGFLFNSIISTLNGKKKTAKKMKSRHLLSELAEVTNAL